VRLCRLASRVAVPHTGTIITAQPNEVWASDHTMTATVEEGQVTVFVAVDHCTTECVGLHAAKKATRFEALEPLRQAVRDYCGGFRAGAAAGIRNRLEAVVLNRWNTKMELRIIVKTNSSTNC
jgi:hypothetical protein